jgi:hypothetical protein
MYLMHPFAADHNVIREAITPPGLYSVSYGLDWKSDNQKSIMNKTLNSTVKVISVFSPRSDNLRSQHVIICYYHEIPQNMTGICSVC